MQGFQRWLQHAWIGIRGSRRHFPAAVLDAIEQAIRAAEAAHGGEIQVVIEAALAPAALWRRQDARARALELFAQLHVWDTEDNNGVLIYVLLADRAVEIIADRHIHLRAGEDAWQALAADMAPYLRQGDFQAGLLCGVQGVAAHLASHFPQRRTSGNALPDRPTLI